MSKGRVLIVEDDNNISKLLKYNLEKEGYLCSVVITGEDALDILEVENFDLILLDIMLPKMDGFETCKRIKQEKESSGIPIIMLTARGEEIDRIVGLELGADDYVVKPFSPREILLRIKAILKRHQRTDDSEQDILTYKNIKVDIPRHVVTIGKSKVALSRMEFNLLVTLMQRKGRVQSRDVLLDNVWGFSSEVTTRTVDAHVKLLRQKLGKSGKIIETIRGVGYKISDEE